MLGHTFASEETQTVHDSMVGAVFNDLDNLLKAHEKQGTCMDCA